MFVGFLMPTNSFMNEIFSNWLLLEFHVILSSVTIPVVVASFSYWLFLYGKKFAGMNSGNYCL